MHWFRLYNIHDHSSINTRFSRVSSTISSQLVYVFVVVCGPLIDPWAVPHRLPFPRKQFLEQRSGLAQRQLSPYTSRMLQVHQSLCYRVATRVYGGVYLLPWIASRLAPMNLSCSSTPDGPPPTCAANRLPPSRPLNALPRTDRLLPAW